MSISLVFPAEAIDHSGIGYDYDKYTHLTPSLSDILLKPKEKRLPVYSEVVKPSSIRVSSALGFIMPLDMRLCLEADPPLPKRISYDAWEIITVNGEISYHPVRILVPKNTQKVQ